MFSLDGARRRTTRTLRLPALGRVAVVAVLTLSATAFGGMQQSFASEAGGSEHCVSARAFHDQMRELWDDHINYTRLTIVSFAGGLPDLSATETRLLQNQTDLGSAFKPFFGDAAGDQLTALLRVHIRTAVDVLVAAKAGNTAAFNDANAKWYANANDIADFLHSLNPGRWSDADLRAMMKEHLDITLKEASDQLTGHFAESITDFDQVRTQILGMADTLSSGIIDAFPSSFCCG
jgi:hypothetical protein